MSKMYFWNKLEKEISKVTPEEKVGGVMTTILVVTVGGILTLLGLLSLMQK